MEGRCPFRASRESLTFFKSFFSHILVRSLFPSFTLYQYVFFALSDIPFFPVRAFFFIRHAPLKVSEIFFSCFLSSQYIMRCGKVPEESFFPPLPFVCSDAAPLVFGLSSSPRRDSSPSGESPAPPFLRRALFLSLRIIHFLFRNSRYPPMSKTSLSPLAEGSPTLFPVPAPRRYPMAPSEPR